MKQNKWIPSQGKTTQDHKQLFQPLMIVPTNISGGYRLTKSGTDRRTKIKMSQHLLTNNSPYHSMLFPLYSFILFSIQYITYEAITSKDKTKQLVKHSPINLSAYMDYLFKVFKCFFIKNMLTYLSTEKYMLTQHCIT